MSEQVGRTREAITASRESIARSKQRISDSRHILERPHPGFALSRIDLTDAQRQGLLDLQQAHCEQREIEREVRQTVMGQPSVTRA